MVVGCGVTTSDQVMMKVTMIMIMTFTAIIARRK